MNNITPTMISGFLPVKGKNVQSFYVTSHGERLRNGGSSGRLSAREWLMAGLFGIQDSSMIRKNR
jgi:hypothetical protein